MSGLVAFARDVAFGRLVGVALPDEDDAAAVDALAAALPPEAQAYARGLPPARRVTWVGGRVALRAALDDLGLAAAARPRHATRRGRRCPRASPARSRTSGRAAVALAAVAPGDVTLGVDVELERGPRVDISDRVLTPAERRRVDALDGPARAAAVLRAFAAKEAIYKALDPWLRRYVSFDEVELDFDLGAARFTPRSSEPTFAIEVRDEPLAGHVLVTARVQRVAG